MAKKQTTKQTEPTCETCVFARPAQSNFKEANLQCHRFPPSQDEALQRPGPFPFTIVKPEHWCGEYVLKPKPRNLSRK